MENLSLFIIYIFIALNCGRVFVSKKIKKDSLVILAPLNVVLSFLIILAFGLNYLSLQIFVISILCLIANIHAILRYSEKLYIDRFSFVMKIFCIIVIILTIISSIFFFIYSPGKINNNIQIQKSYYTGNFSEGFTESEIFSNKNLYLTEYKKNDFKGDSKKIIVFFPDKRGGTKSYEPYLQYLSSYDFVVVSCDFFVDSFDWGIKHNDIVRRSYELCKKHLNEGNAYSSEKNYYNIINSECSSIISVLDKKYGNDCSYFFISDTFENQIINSFAFSNFNKIKGCFFLNSINEYKTPGFGCIEMTNPYLAKKLNVKIDKTGFIPKYMAIKTYQKIDFGEEIVENRVPETEQLNDQVEQVNKINIVQENKVISEQRNVITVEKRNNASENQNNENIKIRTEQKEILNIENDIQKDLNNNESSNEVSNENITEQINTELDEQLNVEIKEQVNLGSEEEKGEELNELITAE